MMEKVMGVTNCFNLVSYYKSSMGENFELQICSGTDVLGTESQYLMCAGAWSSGRNLLLMYLSLEWAIIS